MASPTAEPDEFHQQEWLASESLFNIQNGQLSHIPRAWERAARHPTAPRFRGKKIWKRHQSNPGTRNSNEDTNYEPDASHWICPSPWAQPTGAGGVRKKQCLRVANEESDIGYEQVDDWGEYCNFEKKCSSATGAVQSDPAAVSAEANRRLSAGLFQFDYTDYHASSSSPSRDITTTQCEPEDVVRRSGAESPAESSPSPQTKARQSLLIEPASDTSDACAGQSLEQGLVASPATSVLDQASFVDGIDFGLRDNKAERTADILPVDLSPLSPGTQKMGLSEECDWMHLPNIETSPTDHTSPLQTPRFPTASAPERVCDEEEMKSHVNDDHQAESVDASASGAPRLRDLDIHPPHSLPGADGLQQEEVPKEASNSVPSSPGQRRSNADLTVTENELAEASSPSLGISPSTYEAESYEHTLRETRLDTIGEHSQQASEVEWRSSPAPFQQSSPEKSTPRMKEDQHTSDPNVEPSQDTDLGESSDNPDQGARANGNDVEKERTSLQATNKTPSPSNQVLGRTGDFFTEEQEDQTVLAPSSTTHRDSKRKLSSSMGGSPFWISTLYQIDVQASPAKGSPNEPTERPIYESPIISHIAQLTGNEHERSSISALTKPDVQEDDLFELDLTGNATLGRKGSPRRLSREKLAQEESAVFLHGAQTASFEDESSLHKRTLEPREDEGHITGTETSQTLSRTFPDLDSQLDDDTTMLTAFLDRVNASKAAKIAEQPASIAAGRVPQASPTRKPLRPVDTNSPSRRQQKKRVASRKSNAGDEGSLEETSEKRGDARDDGHGFRRSGRRLGQSTPGTSAKSRTSTPSNSIPVRLEGSEPTWTLSQNTATKFIPLDVIALTRANTKRNRGQPCATVIKRLDDGTAAISTSPPAAEEDGTPTTAKKTVNWDEQLVYFQQRQRQRVEKKETKKKTMIPLARMKGLGNGTPGPTIRRTTRGTSLSSTSTA
ncbi:MAG: hypothetical protein M4579_000999 [Chaenotheca gracillima]|nr:MAG: hypothetical protein M4579_000999 [Chaenotheca gracillima]